MSTFILYPPTCINKGVLEIGDIDLHSLLILSKESQSLIDTSCAHSERGPIKEI